MSKLAIVLLLICAVQIFTDADADKKTACDAATPVPTKKDDCQKNNIADKNYCCYVTYKESGSDKAVCKWTTTFDAAGVDSAIKAAPSAATDVKAMCSSNFLIVSALFIVAFLF